MRKTSWGLERELGQFAANRGVTRTYDLRLPSPSRSTGPWGTAEAEGSRGWLAASVQNLASSIFPAPESRGRKPRIRHDVRDPLLLEPQTQRKIR